VTVTAFSRASGPTIGLISSYVEPHAPDVSARTAAVPATPLGVTTRIGNQLPQPFRGGAITRRCDFDLCHRAAASYSNGMAQANRNRHARFYVQRLLC